ncbi:MAG: VapC toxin family PIN domain ribonuclease [Desulfobacteraceae bacterium IS3]|nr:MAG: VapC toxin family PIN domain ribonuclease [Desulfobacteraceae bacterium IS3]
MSLIYLLDTNVISEPLKPLPNKQLVDNIKYYNFKISIPVFVAYELIKGAYQLPKSKKRSRILHYIEDILDKIPILPYTKEAAIWHGKETARLQRIGKSPSFLDAQIASIAKINDLILVTRNIIDFQHFTDLRLENWFI